MGKIYKYKKYPSKKNIIYIFILVVLGLLILYSTKIWLSSVLKNIHLVSVQQDPILAAKKIEDICVNADRDKFQNIVDCYVKYHRDLTRETSAEYATKTLFELQKINEKAKSCHFILHGIGRSTFDKNPKKWKESLQNMPTECDYGGLHGILEGYQEAGGIVDKNTIPGLCVSDEGGCVHAIGHLILVEEENDIDNALGLCKSFNSAKGRHNCMAGVFMERLIPRNLISHGYVSSEKINKWWNQINEYEQLCKSYTGEEGIACWTEISHAAARMFRSNPKTVFEYCDTGLSREAANSCRRHVIIDLVGASKFDLLGIRYMCKLAPAQDPDFENDCYGEIVKSAIIGLHPDLLTNINDFCASIALSHRKRCFATAADGISKRLMDKSQRERVCNTFPYEYKASCGKPEAGNVNNSYKKI